MYNKEETLNELELIIAKLGVSFRDKDKREVLELVQYNESVIAIEILCTQLYEFKITITEEIFNRIRLLAESYGLENKYCERLKELVSWSAQKGHPS